MLNKIHLPALLLCLFFLLPILAFSQKKFQPFSTEQQLPQGVKKLVTQGSVYKIDTSVLQNILQLHPQQMQLQLRFEDTDYILELEQSSPLAKNFISLDAAGKNVFYNREAILHYKGHISGSEKSLVALSLTAESINGIWADENGNVNIGELGSGLNNPRGTHIIYREQNIVAPNPFVCGSDALPAQNETSQELPQFNIPESIMATVNAEPVDIYFEADYKCFQNKGSNVQQTIDWATALFNIVQTLYERDSVLVRMSGIKVYTQPDPYLSLTTTNSILYAFANNMSSGFPGDLAHLLSQRSLGGGIAFLNVLCNSAYYRTGLCGNLSNSYNNLPNYSWSTMVITHETGHNIASNHTQWCGWVGGAIDNCYTTEGGCPQGSAPVNGGTIMSYCHLVSYGINLMNGFGPQPGIAIRNAVRNSTCINPRLSFSKSSETVSEEIIPYQPGCNNYKEVQVKLFLNTTPTIPALITLQPAAYNSPGLQIGAGKDVEVSPLSFTLSDTTPQIITLKIYDDAIIEPLEMMRLDYTIAANGSNARKDNSYILNITSADYAPDSVANQLIFEDNFENTSSALGAFTENVIYGAASPNRWKILQGADALFFSKAAVISNNGVTASYSGSQLSDSTVTRLESIAINSNGFKKIKLNVRYKCVGEGSGGQGGTGGGPDGGTAKDFLRIVFSTDNGTNWVTLQDNIYGRSFASMGVFELLAAAENKSQLKIGFEWHNNSSVVNLPSLIIDSISLLASGSSEVQYLANANNKFEAKIGPNETVHFYNPVTKNIMATLNNKGSHNYGCTTVELVRTGLGATPVWPGLQAEMLANKIFKISSEFPAASNEMEFQLYYTKEEVNAWASATGNNIADAAVIAASIDLTLGIPEVNAQFANGAVTSSFGTKNDFIFKSSFTNANWFGIAKPGIKKTCEGSNSLLLTSDITGSAYQWQLNSGAGFVNLSNNTNYSGAQTSQLQIVNLSGINTGNIYQCKVTTAQGQKVSLAYTLKFTANWSGTFSNAWEDPQNWDCNVVPNQYTDVIISGGTPHPPLLNSNTTIQSLMLRANADLNVGSGKILLITK